MCIKEWFCIGSARSYNDKNSGLGDAKKKVDEVKKELEITFESDKEVLEKSRYINN